MTQNHEIRTYMTPKGKDVFLDWIRKLRDVKIRTNIEKRIDRVKEGNFGDHKFCRDGVWELRIDFGMGYRIYYGIANGQVIVLLCAGSKRSQVADIEQACEYWADWKRRS